MPPALQFLRRWGLPVNSYPIKHAGSDPEAFRLRPVIAVTTSVQPESARIVYAGSDFPHPIRFRFSKEDMDHIVQNRPGSDLDGLARVWPNASGLEASRCAGIVWPGFWQDATSPLPVFPFQTRLQSSTDVPDDTVQNQPGSDLVLPDCVRFWPHGSGPEANRSAKITRPVSGQIFRADPDRMRIGSGMFTGTVTHNGLSVSQCTNVWNKMPVIIMMTLSLRYTMTELRAHGTVQTQTIERSSHKNRYNEQVVCTHAALKH